MSTLRISGLASGMDIDSIVNELMTAERIPLDNLEKDKQILEWQRDDYREMNTLLLELKELSFDMILQSSYLQKTVTSSDESKVTATASASASNVAYMISDATMATAATNISTGALSGTEKIDADQSIWEIRDQFDGDPTFSDLTNTDIWKTKTYTNDDIAVSADDMQFSLAKGAIDVSSLQNEDGTFKSIEVVDSEGNSTFFEIITDKDELDSGKVYIDTDTGTMTFGDAISEGSTIKSFSYDYYTINFSITTYDEDGNPIGNDEDDTDGKYDFEFDATKSLNQILSGITSSDVGILAFYDSATDKVVFTRKETGNYNSDGKEMEFEGDFLTKVLKMDMDNETGGTDATFTLNGLETSRHSNTFTINGVTFSLNDNFTEAQSINISNDTDQVFENIVNFVDKYNETIATINAKINEERYRDYEPLTDAEKEEMTETQIELWEEKAKSGLLQDDYILSSGLSKMRLNFYTPVSSVSNSNYDQLAEIGITTSSNYLDGGKLIIDEDKLKEALSDDVTAVMELFTASGETTSEQGIIRRLRETIDATMDSIEEKAGNSLLTNEQFSIGRSLNDLEDQIDLYEERLTEIEDRYWSQFTAMEQAILEANSQATYLMQQFSY